MIAVHWRGPTDYPLSGEALLRYPIVGRGPVDSYEICSSDHQCELVERCGYGQSGTCFDLEFVVSSP